MSALPFNPSHLAQAIVHWLEYQSLCGRSELFCEAYLSQPIGEYCLSLRPEHFEPEVQYPEAYQKGTKKRRAMDFAIYSMNAANTQRALRHAIEAKFVTAKRNFAPEIYDDLHRLNWFQPTRDPAACQRWLVTAGFRKNLEGSKCLSAKAQIGKGPGKKKVDVFKGLLSRDLHNATRQKPVATAVPELLQYWKDSAEAFGQNQLPDTIKVRLAAKFPKTPHQADATCYIWEVMRPQPDFSSVSSI